MVNRRQPNEGCKQHDRIIKKRQNLSCLTVIQVDTRRKSMKLRHCCKLAKAQRFLQKCWQLFFYRSACCGAAPLPFPPPPIPPPIPPPPIPPVPNVAPSYAYADESYAPRSSCASKLSYLRVEAGKQRQYEPVTHHQLNTFPSRAGANLVHQIHKSLMLMAHGPRRREQISAENLRNTCVVPVAKAAQRTPIEPMFSE